MKLRERIQVLGNNANGNGGSGGPSLAGKSKKLCWKYNRGNCTYGFSCKFDHRCGICNKFGHGAHNCRKGGKKIDDRDLHDKSRQDQKGGDGNKFEFRKRR